MLINLQVSKLVELYKESSEEWSRKAGELEGVIKALEVRTFSFSLTFDECQRRIFLMYDIIYPPDFLCCRTCMRQAEDSYKEKLEKEVTSRKVLEKVYYWPHNGPKRCAYVFMQLRFLMVVNPH